MTKRHIYLIRHGHYHHANRDSGELTDIGQEQAIVTSHALKHLPFTQLIYSPSTRAAQTALIIGEMLPGTVYLEDERLREVIPDIPDHYHDFFKLRYPDATPEKRRAATHTLRQVFEDYFVTPAPDTDDEYVLLVCHGNVIRYLISQVMQNGADFWMRMIIHNCGISRVWIEDSGMMFVASHNDIGHLPVELLTEN